MKHDDVPRGTLRQGGPKWPQHGRSRARRNAAATRAFVHDLSNMASATERAAASFRAVSMALDGVLAATKALPR